MRIRLFLAFVLIVLVAIDAMSTGFSRAVEGEDPKQFHGVQQDIEAFSEFIRLYITKFNRWSSPKYLLGESYGTVRSAGVSQELQSRHGIELNGIVLVSSVIDFSTLYEAPGNDIHYAGFLPTYTVTARFRKELLRDRRLMTGRLDSRFTGIDADAAGETQEFDPSNTALSGAYTALFNDYIRNELKWESELKYRTRGPVRPWDYGTQYRARYLNLVDSLRSTMARNPFLNVLVANGIYDMATPFAATEWTFDHLGFEPTYRERVSLTYYEAGHMMYIRPSMHKKFKQDVAQFIRDTKDASL